jgi:hypothetical protein
MSSSRCGTNICSSFFYRTPDFAVKLPLSKNISLHLRGRKINTWSASPTARKATIENGDSIVTAGASLKDALGSKIDGKTLLRRSIYTNAPLRSKFQFPGDLDSYRSFSTTQKFRDANAVIRDSNGGALLKEKARETGSQRFPQDYSRSRTQPQNRDRVVAGGSTGFRRMKIGPTEQLQRRGVRDGFTSRKDLESASDAQDNWKVQKRALVAKFGEQGWNPRKRLSPDALEGIRALHSKFPEEYTTDVLATQFEISPEAIRRILKSKWRPNEAEEAARKQRWCKRGEGIWNQMVELGIRPPKKWKTREHKQVNISDYDVLSATDEMGSCPDHAQTGRDDLFDAFMKIESSIEVTDVTAKSSSQPRKQDLSERIT